jgi:excisionase family DNA binding protein
MLSSLLARVRGGIVEEPMMTARQVAELLGVHENWVYDQAVAGVLPSYKIGGSRRFQADELRGWIAEHRQPVRETKPRKRVRRMATPLLVQPALDPQPKLFEG